MKIHCFRLFMLALLPVSILTAQAADDTQLKHVILFGRHGVRSPVLPNTTSDTFSSLPFPTFSVLDASQPLGSLTVNGATNETILGGYYRLWLTQEGLLTGKDSADAAFVYFRANGFPLIIATAEAFAAGMLPGAKANVDTVTPNDPLFVPLNTGVAMIDERKAVAGVNGRIGGNPQWLLSAYAAELALMRSVLFNYPVSQTPAPATPAGKIDVTAIPVDVTAGTSTTPVNIGGLTQVIGAIDPFVMEYTDGLPAADVGWGQLTAGSIGQIYRLYDLLLNLEYRTPYLARVQSSNLASHIVRSLVQAAIGNPISGALGNPSTKVIVLTAANTNIEGLAGLLQLDWILPSYQADVASPGGVLMFELRQSQSTGEYIVRATYVSQTMDQLRNRTLLTLTTPPASAPVFIPGCSVGNATFDCPLADFVEVAKHAIDPQSADLVN